MNLYTSSLSYPSTITKGENVTLTEYLDSKIHGYAREPFAAKLGISRQQLHNIESGRCRSIDINILKEIYILTQGMVTIFGIPSKEDKKNGKN